MAFSDRVRQEEFGVFVVLEIDGWDLVVSDAPLPGAWEDPSNPGHILIDGEPRRWHQCLHFDEDFGKVVAKIDPKKGLGSSGSLTFNLLTYGDDEDASQDPILDALNNNVNRLDRNTATLESDLIATTVASGGIDLSTNPWNGQTIDLHLGEEVIGFGDDGDTITRKNNIVARGKYGSRIKAHRADQIRENERTPNGMIVSEWPLWWKGRGAKMHLCTIDMAREGFHPYGDSLTSDENWQAFSGIVQRFEEGDDLLTVSLQIASLDAALRGDVCRRFPTFKAGPSDGWFDPKSGAPIRQYLGPHNWWVHFYVQGAGIFNGPLIDYPVIGGIADGDTLTIGGLTLTFSAAALSTNATTVKLLTNPGEERSQLEEVTKALDLNGAPYDRWGWRGGLTLDLSNYQLTDAQLDAWEVTTNAAGLYVYPAKWVDQEKFAGYDLRLRRLAAVPGFYEDVPEGEYTPSELAGYLADTINERLPNQIIPRFGSGFSYNDYLGPHVRAALSWDTGRDGKPKARLSVTSGPLSITREWSFSLLDRYRVRSSFIHEWGYNSTSGTWGESEDENKPSQMNFSADRAPARFWWPSRSQILPSRLYMHGWESAWDLANIDNDVGWADRDGATIAPHLLIDDVDIIRIAQDSRTSAPPGTQYVTVLERALFGANKVEETYIEQEPPDKRKDTKVYRVPAFPNSTASRVLKYAVLGGSGSPGLNGPNDAGWEDAGLYMLRKYVDEASFDQFDQEQPRDNWVWRPGQKLVELIDEESKLCQWQFCTGGGQLYLVSLDPPLETRLEGAFRLDPLVRVTTDSRGPGFRRNASMLVNEVLADADYDHSTGKSLLKVETLDATSQSTWGKQQTMRLKVKGIAGRGDANAQLKGLGNQVFSNMGRPYMVAAFDTGRATTWQLRNGATVLLTSPEVPDPDRAGRGVVDLPCILAQNTVLFFGDDAKKNGNMVLISRAYGGKRFSEMVPSADLSAWSGGTGETWSSVKTTYSLEDVADLSFFKEGFRVLIAQKSNFALKAARTITSIGALTDPAPTITFDAPLSWNAPSVMWFADYDDENTTAEQLRYVYWSDGRNILFGANENAIAYSYV